MGEWYAVDPSLPKLTEQQSTWLRKRVRNKLLSHRKCGTVVSATLPSESIEAEVRIFINEDVKKEFQACADYLIFLNVSTGADAAGQVTGHQNALYIRKSDKKVFWIEPQHSESTGSLEEEVRPFIDEIIKQLGIADYTLVVPEETCVQAVAEDNNCVFWSMLLYQLIMEGKADTTGQASKIVLGRFKTPEELRTFVEQLKSTWYYHVFQKTDVPTAGKRKSPWVPSTESLARSRSSRRTTRRRQTSKSKSRRLTSARHTRKHKLRHSM